MALKFRRGTTAQQSGSLAFGEPFVNTTLGTLVVGGENGDIVLSSAGTASTANFGAISGSGLDISGNANISGDLTLGGQLTIGDQTSDTINVVASVSSSLTPSDDNSFDIGSNTKRYKNIYAQSISASILSNITGSVNKIAYFSADNKIQDVGIFRAINNGATIAIGTDSFDATHPERFIVEAPNTSHNIATFVTQDNDAYAQFNIKNTGTGTEASTDLVFWNDSTTEDSNYLDIGINSSNYNAGFVGYGNDSYIFAANQDLYIGANQTGSEAHLHLYGGNQWETPALSINENNIINLSSSVIPNSDSIDLGSTSNVYRNVYATSISGAIASTNGVVSGSSQVIGILDSLNTYTSSLNNAIQLTGSTVSFLGDIIVYGTQSVINSTNVEISDNILYLSPTASIDNDLGIVGNYNDGTYRHAGIFMDASDGHSWKVFNGLQDETSAQIDTGGTGFTLADFKAGAITGTSFSGNILSTNGVVSGSSQVIGILSSLNSYTASNDTTNSTQNSRLDQLSTASGSAISRLTALEVETSNLETFSSSALTRLSTLEGTDISITLTGDVTGTGTITNLANVSFATTIAANSVALGTDTTGNYVASLVAGTGITLSNNSGEGATPTIAIGQAVATSSNVQFNSLGIGMAASATAGRIDATNDIVAYSSSDIRFKENITPIENALDKISKISGNTYDWKEENKIEHGYEGNDVGVIAQEIEAVLPQLVQTRENGYKAVKYDKLVALLIEGIKEQQTQIHSLTLEIEKLKESKGL